MHETDELDNQATIERTIAATAERHDDILRDIKLLETEIERLNADYTSLGTQLTSLSQWHRNIVQLAYELIDDTKGAIEMRRIGMKCEERHVTEHHTVDLVRNGAIFKHSRTIVTRRETMQENQDPAEDTLTSHDAKQHVKKLYVSLNRLPSSVVMRHTTNCAPSREASFDETFMNNPRSPTYTSTPLDIKAQTLREIYGLTPVQELRNSKPTQPSPPYINTRRRALIKYSLKSEVTYEQGGNTGCADTTDYPTPPSSRSGVQPLQESHQNKRAILENGCNNSSIVKKIKMDEVSPPLRPRRRARPQNLREMSLRSKMRRH